MIHLSSESTMLDCEQHLYDDELGRESSLRVGEDRNRYIVSRVWLRRLLAEFGAEAAAWRFDHDPTGRPIARVGSDDSEEKKIHFSVSYTENTIACAASDRCSVGIDLAPIKPIHNFHEIVGKVLHASELAATTMEESYESLTRFHRLWAAKESLLKAIGRKIDIPPSDIAFTEEERGTWRLFYYPVARLGDISCTTISLDVESRTEPRRSDCVLAASALAPMISLSFREIFSGDNHPGGRDGERLVRTMMGRSYKALLH
jgi:phosphopantetheinyl transferase